MAASKDLNTFVKDNIFLGQLPKCVVIATFFFFFFFLLNLNIYCYILNVNADNNNNNNSFISCN